MASLDDAVDAVAGDLLAESGLHHIAAVEARLRTIARQWGLGVAVLAAWRHGLRSGHIPTAPPGGAGDPAGRIGRGVQVIPAEGPCPYTFVHVPVRTIRGDAERLARLGIVSRDPDASGFVYHEDGLIGPLSFATAPRRPAGLDDARLLRLLGRLQGAGLLVRANPENRQIQFKDLRVKRRMEQAGPVYARTVVHQLSAAEIATAVDEPIDPASADFLARQINRRQPCYYCSVAVMYPQEATLHTVHATDLRDPAQRRRATRRNYQLGFTFAPFGDPAQVCHFLAWDFPHISDLVNNMDPRSYSFGDLGKLVRQINHDVAAFCAEHDVDRPETISGACNHWAGNSIYHQHYQFFRLPQLPLTAACDRSHLLAEFDGVQVRRVDGWPAPAYLITGKGTDLTSNGTDAAVTPVDTAVMQVADRVARHWRILGQGVVDDYGNGIGIRNHTQNIFVAEQDGRLVALFLPRLRRRIDAFAPTLPEPHRHKRNAGVLEMMGYFIVDSSESFAVLQGLTAQQRRDVGDEWLGSLSPDEAAIHRFETALAGVDADLGRVLVDVTDDNTDTGEVAGAVGAVIRTLGGGSGSGTGRAAPPIIDLTTRTEPPEPAEDRRESEA